MKGITQGTIINGIRSTKYPDIMTYGIVISAACDLAQDKIEKIFYLTAIPLKEWLCSKKGFQLVTGSSVLNSKDNLLRCLEKYDLSFEVVQMLSKDELEKVLFQYKDSIKPKEYDSIIKQFGYYQHLAKEDSTKEDKAEILLSESKTVATILGDIFSGKNTHYCFLPTSAISESLDEGYGLIVDLLELDYLPLETVKKIASGEIDCKELLEPEKAKFDKRFYIKEHPGFAYPVSEMLSPWREYILQHFSNCFIRIGVDNPGRNEAKGIVESLFRKEETM